MRTDVTITIDTEFSIAGSFHDPVKYAPLALDVVDCMVSGKGQGLPFILETLADFGIPATFFVESLNGRYFGDRPMGGVVERLLTAGQDVQLHLHPSWMAFDNGGLTANPPNDHCDGRTSDELMDIISFGLDAMKRWGAPRPLALRTGNLNVDKTVYSVMSSLGLPAASNVGIGIFKPADPALHFTGGRHMVEGVMEIPLLSFRDFGSYEHYRPLQITACSWLEMERVLRTAHALGVANVVILTHPFEYIKVADSRYQRTTTNRLVQERLKRLCAFLADNPDKFRAVSFKEGVPEWLKAGEVDDPLIRTAPHLTVMRMAENKLNDLMWSY